MVFIDVAAQVLRDEVVRESRCAAIVNERYSADRAAIGAVVKNLIGPDDIRADRDHSWIERIIGVFRRVG